MADTHATHEGLTAADHRARAAKCAVNAASAAERAAELEAKGAGTHYLRRWEREQREKAAVHEALAASLDRSDELHDEFEALPPVVKLRRLEGRR